MPQFRYAPLRYLSILLLAWLAVFFLTRSLLLVGHLADTGVTASSLFGIYAVGLVYDLSFLLYAAVPLLLFPLVLWKLPQSLGFLIRQGKQVEARRIFAKINIVDTVSGKCSVKRK